MNTFLGVSETLSVTEVNEAAISASTWVYLEGYLVTSPTGHAAALKTKQLAEANNTKVAVSFSDPGMVTFFRDNMNAMLEGGVDFVFCNEIEALEWAQTDNLDEAAERLQAICRSFVITRSADGAILYDGTSMHRVAAEKVKAVNTNGAGDMFAGAFFYALWRGADMVSACEFAAKAAGAVVCQAGPRLSLDTTSALRDAYFSN
jgi:sugar/nucleoside kinase (ribokinase family)